MRRRILLALLVPALAACGLEGREKPMTLESEKELTDKVLQIERNGGSAALATLTGFEWDTVYCYMEGAKADQINAEVGHIVIKPGERYTSSYTLAVFLKGGEVVKALLLPELTFIPGRQPDGVVLDGGKLRAPA